jgi:central glycolytic genes regulator
MCPVGQEGKRLVNKLFYLQQRLVPDLLRSFEERYLMLREIYFNQPMGRRALSQQMKLPERLIRNEAEKLREQGLVEIGFGGMSLTHEGVELIWELSDYIRELQGVTDLEERLARKYGLEKAIVVEGDTDKNMMVKRELGRATAKYLIDLLHGEKIVAVTGGTTLAEVANFMLKKRSYPDVIFVPARGGLGEKMEEQANTIAAKLAERLDAKYHLLHVPDNISVDALHLLATEPQIEEILQLIHRADIVIHGIGVTGEMAKKRGLKAEQVDFLREKNAVAEVFGFYFDPQGKIVHWSEKLGLVFSDLKDIPTVIGVAGGKSKGEAIKAVLTHGYQDVLITDEGAAHVLLE